MLKPILLAAGLLLAASQVRAQDACIDHLEAVGLAARSAFATYDKMPTMRNFRDGDVRALADAIFPIIDGGVAPALAATIRASDLADVLSVEGSTKTIVIFSNKGCITGSARVEAEHMQEILFHLAQSHT